MSIWSWRYLRGSECIILFRLIQCFWVLRRLLLLWLDWVWTSLSLSLLINNFLLSTPNSKLLWLSCRSLLESFQFCLLGWQLLIPDHFYLLILSCLNLFWFIFKTEIIWNLFLLLLTIFGRLLLKRSWLSLTCLTLVMMGCSLISLSIMYRIDLSFFLIRCPIIWGNWST